MIKVAAALGGVLLLSYVAFPDARALVVASAPVLLALACPIAMIVMVFMMRATSAQKKDMQTPTAQEEEAPAPKVQARHPLAEPTEPVPEPSADKA